MQNVLENLKKLFVSSTVDIFRQYFTYFTYFSSRNILWLDYRAFKVDYDLTTVRSKLPMIRLSCVQCCLCPDYGALNVVYVQTIVRSMLSTSGISCVQNCLCPDYRALKVAYVQTTVRSKILISRLSSVHWCFADRVFWNAWHPLVRSFWSGHTDVRYLWETSLALLGD